MLKLQGFPKRPQSFEKKNHLRDQTRPCEIKQGLARSNLALRDQIWPCEINNGLARSNIALQNRIWPCENKYGRASFEKKNHSLVLTLCTVTDKQDGDSFFKFCGLLTITLQLEFYL